jgi:hypothetical protein
VRKEQAQDSGLVLEQVLLTTSGSLCFVCFRCLSALDIGSQTRIGGARGGGRTGICGEGIGQAVWQLVCGKGLDELLRVLDTLVACQECARRERMCRLPDYAGGKGQKTGRGR